MQILQVKKIYKNKKLQSKMAYKSGYYYKGRDFEYKLDFPQAELFGSQTRYEPYFGKQCAECGSRPICNGCSRCGKCAT